MNIDQLFANYEQVSDAPDAVSRLRRFVLNLAVRGRLVEQNPDDEPASELLKRIALEKARLIETGEVKKNKSKPTKVIEKNHELPKSWEWVTLGDVFIYDAGIKREPETLDTDMWLLELKDIEKDTGRLLARAQTSERKSKSTKSEFRVGDILYGKLRPYLNKVLVADRPGYSTTEIVALRPYLSQCSEYYALALRRPDFVIYVNRLGQGTKMPRLRTQDAIAAPFPLPPLEEQHRIVTKVNKLMSLCDQLEEKQLGREAKRNLLTTVSLNRLNIPNLDKTAFRNDVNFALDNFTSLTARPRQIKELLQTIFNLAVRGKLVEQDPADELASELLKQILREKACLVKAKKIKKSKVAPITSEDVPFSVPVSWIWTRLGEIGDWGSGSTPARSNPDLYGGGVTWIKSGELNDNINLMDSEETVTELAVKKGSFRVNQPGDVLIAMYGATIGKLAILGKTAVTNQAVCGCTPFNGVLNHFLFLFLLAQRKEFHATSEGGAQPNISKLKIVQTPFPLPPLAEQYRIVTKVRELMNICDRIEANLATCNNIRRQLLDTLLEKFL